MFCIHGKCLDVTINGGNRTNYQFRIVLGSDYGEKRFINLPSYESEIKTVILIGARIFENLKYLLSDYEFLSFFFSYQFWI